MDRVSELLDEVASMEGHAYGERVDMLQHSLQTAAVARSRGAKDELVLAGLLHDVGHLHGKAGDWGLPDHAEVGAAYLDSFFPAEITEPIRLHVDAKRYLVATDPDYAESLSEASTMSLAEQGGPFDALEVERFAAEPFAADAVVLRRCDDDGKTIGLDIPGLETYRRLVERFLLRPTVSPRWARDACRCSACRDSGNDQHLLDVRDLSGWSVRAIAEDGPTLTVELARDDDRHRCHIPIPELDPIEFHTWGASHDEALRAEAVSAPDVDGFARQLASAGVCLVSGVPVAEGAVLDFAASVGFVRETNYGTLFEVRAVADPNNLAYTSVGLPLHTDNPYRDPCPTVQLLHCLQQASAGGATRLSDGFDAAERLRASDPEAFDTLATTPLRFRFHDDDVDLQAVRPMIELGVDGAVAAVSVNHRSMEAPDPCAVSVDRFYAAYERFAALLDDGAIELTLRPGELVAFDNRRVLHARTAFPAADPRHLQGCYIDMDAVRSNARRVG